jgi:iron(III) transport system substrate-binding protein
LREAERSGFRAVGVLAAALGIAYNSRELAHKAELARAALLGGSRARREYRGEVEMPNPISSSTAYATLATLVQLFGRGARLRAAARDPPLRPGRYQRTDAGIDAKPRTGRDDGRGHVAARCRYRDRQRLPRSGSSAPCEGAGLEVYAMSIMHGTPRMDGARRFYDWALGVFRAADRAR